MVRVITYGTYDLLHHGHIRLLERAKALGDYLIVGVTADDFDKARGKINVQQSLIERLEAVQATGIADEVIVEEYEGQKIDDIRRYNADIFTVGSDWVGKFDYLNEYCQVIYLPRTEGVSSSELRTERRSVRLGLVGESNIVRKFIRECGQVNGIRVSGVFTETPEQFADCPKLFESYDALLEDSDAVYVVSEPSKHAAQIREALERGKDVLCESPIALNRKECESLFALADRNGRVLMESTKTAYSLAYHRMSLLVKTGVIGRVVSLRAVCTSIRDIDMSNRPEVARAWNSIHAWGPTVMLPVFQLLGTDYLSKNIVTLLADEEYQYDLYTKIDFLYPNAVGSVEVGQGVKSEGELVISGTKGYIYVPAPWWKTEYFEVRYERPENNRRYFYQLEGEGIRYELVTFLRSVVEKRNLSMIDRPISVATASVLEDFHRRSNINFLSSEQKSERDVLRE